MTLQPWLAIACLTITGASAGWSAAIANMLRRDRIRFGRRLTALFAVAAICAVIGTASAAWTLVTGWGG